MEASSITMGRKQHSLTTTGDKEITLMARGDEHMAPARKEAPFLNR